MFVVDNAVAIQEWDDVWELKTLLCRLGIVGYAYLDADQDGSRAWEDASHSRGCAWFGEEQGHK